MSSSKQQPHLTMQIIWKDEDMIELKVSAANDLFSGATDVYSTQKELIDFAKKLVNFPTANDVLEYKAGIIEDYAYCNLRFYCIDNAGHIGISITLMEENYTGFGMYTEDQVKLNLVVVPSDIDYFQKLLYRMAVAQEGTVTLKGNI